MQRRTKSRVFKTKNSRPDWDRDRQVNNTIKLIHWHTQTHANVWPWPLTFAFDLLTFKVVQFMVFKVLNSPSKFLISHVLQFGNCGTIYLTIMWSRDRNLVIIDNFFSEIIASLTYSQKIRNVRIMRVNWEWRHLAEITVCVRMAPSEWRNVSQSLHVVLNGAHLDLNRQNGAHSSALHGLRRINGRHFLHFTDEIRIYDVQKNLLMFALLIDVVLLHTIPLGDTSLVRRITIQTTRGIGIGLRLVIGLRIEVNCIFVALANLGYGGL